MTTRDQLVGAAAVVGGAGLLAWAWWRGVFDTSLLAPRRHGLGSSVGSLGEVTGPTAADVDALARLILVESAESGIGRPEGAGVAHVGLNRVRSGRYPSVEAAVTKRGGKDWFGRGRDPGYCYFTGAHLCPGRARGGRLVWESRRWLDAVRQASRILQGDEDNPIGPRMLFVHPGGMPACPAPGAVAKGRICRDTHAGLRWMPAWAIPPTQGGLARTEPLLVGEAVFAGYGGAR